MNRSQRKPYAALLIVVVVISFLIVRQGMRSDVQVERVSEFRDRPVSVARQVYVLGGLSPGVAYAIETSDGIILIDAGVESNASRLTQQLQWVGLRIEDVRIVLLTHSHGDHFLGARRIREISGARVYAGAADCPVIESGKPLAAVFSTYTMPGVVPHSTKVDERLRGGETIRLGDIELAVLATPGHSPGSLCFQMQRHGEHYLFSGDTISTYSGSLGTDVVKWPPIYRGDAGQYLSSLQRLAALPLPDYLLTGHPGRRPDGGDLVKISESVWRETLARAMHEVQETIERHEADGADFLDGNAKRISTHVAYLGQRRGYNVYCVLDGERSLLIDAPGDGDERLSTFVTKAMQSLGFDVIPHAVLLTSLDEEATRGLEEDELSRWDIVVPDDLLDACRDHFADKKDADKKDADKKDADKKDAAARNAAARNAAARNVAGRKVIKLGQWLQGSALQIEPVGLPGRIEFGTGYTLTTGDSVTLFTGDSVGRLGEPNARSFFAAFRRPAGVPADFIVSLNLLKDLSPDVWLPARSLHGQNANLYDDEWVVGIGELRAAVTAWLARPR